MKLDKLLRSNIFLINSSVCVVVLLFLCYFSLNTTIKNTYSDEGESLVGTWIWNDKLDLDEMDLIYLDIAYPVSFKDDSDISYKSIKILGSGFSDDYNIYYDSTSVAYTDFIYNGKLNFSDSESKILHFDNTNTNVDSQFVGWFKLNATPYNRCYYNSGSKTYVWTNDFNVGVLYSELTTQEMCEGENRKNIVVTYNVDGKTDDVTVKIGDSITLRNVVKDGYSFKGWYTTATGGEKKGTFGESFTPTDNITLYAQFEAFAINVDFKDYNVEGNYIFVDADTTPDEFEENIEVSESGVSFIYSPASPSLLHTGLNFEISLVDGRKDKYIFVILGDVSGNGILDTMDYVKIYNHIKNNKLNDVEKVAADYYKDGSVNTMDYVKVYNQLKGVTE